AGGVPARDALGVRAQDDGPRRHETALPAGEHNGLGRHASDVVVLHIDTQHNTGERHRAVAGPPGPAEDEGEAVGTVHTVGTRVDPGRPRAEVAVPAVGEQGVRVHAREPHGGGRHVREDTGTVRQDT
ncbi:hypothetical protein THAOC_25945, partial [Thalassiosira oceanica]